MTEDYTAAGAQLQPLRLEGAGRVALVARRLFGAGDLAIEDLRRGDPAQDLRAPGGRDLRGQLLGIGDHEPRAQCVAVRPPGVSIQTSGRAAC